MINKVHSIDCKETYIEDVNLERLTRTEISKLCVIDTRSVYNSQRYKSCYNILSIDYYPGFVTKLWSSYTSRYRFDFGNKRYLVVDSSKIIDLQNEDNNNNNGTRYNYVRWATPLPPEQFAKLKSTSKALYDF